MKKTIFIFFMMVSLVQAQNPRSLAQIDTSSSLADSTLIPVWADSSSTNITRKLYVIDFLNYIYHTVDSLNALNRNIVFSVTGSGTVVDNTASSGILINATTANTGLDITNTNAGAGPGLILYHNDATPVAGNQISSISLNGEDAASDEEQFVYITGTSERIVDGEEAGGLNIAAQMNGTLRSFLYLDGYTGTTDEGAIVVNNDGRDIDFNIKSAATDSAFVIQGSDGTIYMESLANGTGTQLSRVTGTDEIVLETSSMKYKKLIRDWKPKINIMDLKPRRFVWNDKSAVPGKPDVGLIVEEVGAVAPELIEGDMWHTQKMITYLISVIQDQEKRIKALEDCECMKVEESGSLWNVPYWIPDNGVLTYPTLDTELPEQNRRW